jgi:hypothetical protein
MSDRDNKYDPSTTEAIVWAIVLLIAFLVCVLSRM